MRTNTMITLGASAAFGIMAVVLARGWIHDAINAEFAQTRTTPVLQSAQVQLDETIDVLVANLDLNFGDQLTSESVRVVSFPEDSVPFGALESVDDLFGRLETLDANQPVLALAPIRMNEAILPHKVSGLGGQGSLSARIRPGYRAATIRVNDITGVAGFVVPGDLVDVLYVDQPDPEATVPNYRGRVLLQSLKVLGADQRYMDGTAEPIVSRSVTLEVDNASAQTLFVAQETGLLTLVLRGLGETTPSANITVESETLGSPARAVMRNVRRSGGSIKSASNPTVAKITVIRGEVEESVSVRREDIEPSREDTVELAGG